MDSLKANPGERGAIFSEGTGSISSSGIPEGSSLVAKYR